MAALVAGMLAGVLVDAVWRTSPAAAASYQSTVEANGPTAYWRLNEASGSTAADSSGNGHSCTYANVTLGATGAISGSTGASLNGTSSTVSCGTGPAVTGTGAFSLELWVNTTAGSVQYQPLINQRDPSSTNDSFSFQLTYGKPEFWLWNTTGNEFDVTAGSVADGNWHHLVAERTSNGSAAIYVDGVSAASSSPTTSASLTSRAVTVGADGRDNTIFFNGTMDDVAVYSLALTSSQVLADYEASGRTPTVAPGSHYASTVLADTPVGYWRLGEQSGTAAADATGHGHSGTYSGTYTLGGPGALLGVNDTSVYFAQTGYVNVGSPSALELTGDLSVEAWVNLPATGNSAVIGADDNINSPWPGYSFGVGQGGAAAGRVGFYVGAGSSGGPWLKQTAGPLVNDGQWHQIVGTVHGNVMAIYVDGAATGDTTTYSGTRTAYSGTIDLAREPVSGTSLFAGRLEEVAIYSFALSSSQVAAHFEAAGDQPRPTGGALQSPEHYGGAAPSQCPNGGAGQVTANPVDTESGNFWHTFTDVDIPCRGLGIDITRTFNSAAAASNGPFGYGWSFNSGMSLGVAGSTATLTEENGTQETFTLSGSTWSPSAPRTIATLVHNGDGTWTVTRNAQETFNFNSSGQVTSMKDLNGYTTTFSYTSGNLTGETDAAGRSISIGWTGSHVTSVTDSNVSGNTRTVTYGYNDGNGNLTDVVDVNGGHTSFTYDSSHRVTVMKDPVCYATSGCPGVQNHYNASGQVDWQKDQLNRETTFSYTGTPTSASGGTTTITDPKGNVQVDGYQWGVRTYVTRGYGSASAATTRFGYDPTTLAPTVVIDPNGNLTYSTYDSNGNLLTSTDPLGRTTTSTYNSLNEPLTVQDGRGVTTTYTYDSSGNLQTKSTPVCSSPPCTGSPPNQVTTYTYGDSTHPGDVTSMTDPDSKTWTYTYDTYGDRTSVTDPLGNKATSTFNADGWKLTDVSPKGNVSGCGCATTYTTTYSYTIPGGSTIDEFGDVQTVTDPLSHVTTYGYDADRNKTSVKDADANTTTYVFDAANELTQTKRADSPQTTLTTDYNSDGTVADQKDGKGSATLTYGYDALARVTTVTDAVSNVTTYTYDGDGNRITQQDPAGSCTGTVTKCTTFTYDADNEPLTITYSDGTTPNVSAITYDADGHRTAMTDGTGSSAWVYDSLGRLTSYTNGNSAQVQWSYNLRNLATTVTYPASHAVTDGYDDAGRMTSVQDWLATPNTTSFGYDTNSNLTTETFPSGSGLVDTFGFNAADQMTSISDVTGGTTLFSATYTRDANGQLASDTSVPSASGAFKYSPLNQLCYAGSSTSTACSSPPSGSTAYGFDAADNLTTNNGKTQQFNTADQLCWTVTGGSSNNCSSAPTGATTYGYDTRGNQTGHVPSTGSATCDAYDQADRLTTITTGTGSSCTSPTTVGAYTYNGDGLRMKKVVSSTTTQYTWDPTGSVPQLLQETAGSNTTSYLYGPGGLPVEQLTPSGTALFYSHDQLGSTRLVTNGSGATQATYTYDPYGNLTSSTNPGSITNPLRYGGQYADAESGLLYLRARYYDPTTAQFVTQDPLVAGTLSPYAYVAGSPLNGVDGSGLCRCDPSKLANLLNDMTNHGDLIEALANTARTGQLYEIGNTGTYTDHVQKAQQIASGLANCMKSNLLSADERSQATYEHGRLRDALRDIYRSPYFKNRYLPLPSSAISIRIDLNTIRSGAGVAGALGLSGLAARGVTALIGVGGAAAEAG